MKPNSPHVENKACQHLALAHSKVGDVMICADCGVVHLALQSISMRFDMDAFSELSRMLGRAQTAIEMAQEKAQERMQTQTKEHPHEQMQQHGSDYFHHGNFALDATRKVH